MAALRAGDRIGVHEILAPIGTGGMGEVYRARDTRLGRDVAIKVLPEGTTSPERLARFEREARVLAALNHPNIGTIHGVEDADGFKALVLELVAGQTLYERLIKGPLPVAEAAGYARQIVEALAAAHEHGIVHRDLKPSNIKLLPDGALKVLDFGLATEADDVSTGAALSRTITIGGTAQGTILGTAAYMSPEQARGQAVDKRTDIWAFGCVLYEMLTGARAFDGDNSTVVLAHIIERDPDFARLPASTPQAIRTLLGRCLQKDRKRRLADIADAAFDLDQATMASARPAREADFAGAPQRSRERLAWVTAAIFLITCVILATFLVRARPDGTQPVRFSVIPPSPGVLITERVGGGGLMVPALSPDGRQLVFEVRVAGRNQLWVRSLAALDARPLAGTEDSSGPFWSPDSRKIGFLQNSKLKIIDAVGGPVQEICDVSGPGVRGGWSQHGVIVFGSFASGIFKVSAAAGAAPVQITTPDSERRETAHRHPSFLPDGRRFAFIAWPTRTIWLGSIDGTETTRLVAADSQAEFTSEHLLFVRNGTLMAQRFDRRADVPAGEATPVVEQLLSDDSGFAAFSTSQTGVLAYRSGNAAIKTRLDWVDRAGKLLGPAVPEPQFYLNPELSNDDSRVAVEIIDHRNTSDIWSLDLARGTKQRLTFDPASESQPIWSPDGSRVLFGSNRQKGSLDAFDGHRHPPGGLYETRVIGSGNDDVILDSDAANESVRPIAVSPDGKHLVYEISRAPGEVFARPNAPVTLNVVPLVGERRPMALSVELVGWRSQGQPSPDGRWLAYVSSESSRDEVLIRSFPGPGVRRQISLAGGIGPRWRGDGKELFYQASTGQLMAVSIETTQTTLDVGKPVPLFTASILNGPQSAIGSYLAEHRAQYDVSGDGQRFLVNVPVDAQDADGLPSSITVVLNWLEGVPR